MQRWPGCCIPLCPLCAPKCSHSPSLCLFQFAICFLEGEWLELSSISQTRFHQNLLALRLPCLQGKYFVLLFVASHWQPMFVSCVFLPLPLASYKLFGRKLFTPSRRDCTLGKQKVQLRVSLRSPRFFIIRFPGHSYIVSKDPSWKQIPRVTSHILFHSFFSLSGIIPLTFSIFLLEFSCLFLLPHFIMFFSDLRHVFPTYRSFCPLYPLIYPKPEPWVSAKTPKFRVKGILFPQLFAGIFPGPTVQISECLLSKTDTLQPHSNPRESSFQSFHLYPSLMQTPIK